MDIDDALKTLDEPIAKEAPKVETSSTPTSGGDKNYGNKEKQWDPWEDEIIPRELDKTNLKRFSRTFAVSGTADVTDEAIGSFRDVLETINNLGFTMRSPGDERDRFNKIITENFSRKEYILPWKKFNTNVEATVVKPTKFSYELSATFHKAFKKLSNAVRGFIARDTHIFLGKDCDTPINFLIIYTSCGIENNDKIDFKTTGNASYFINLASELNVPIFNFKNKDAKDRLVTYLETFKN